MIEFFGLPYVPLEPESLALPSYEVAPLLIGNVIVHENRLSMSDSSRVETASAFSCVEAYDESDRATHSHPEHPAHRRSTTQLGPHGTVYVHSYARSGMCAMDIVCGAEGYGSSVLIRAAIPVIGLDAMIARRCVHPDADRAVRERRPGFERRLLDGPCKFAEGMGINPLLDGASLFRAPFRIYRPLVPITDLFVAPRINITRDAGRLWRWEWRNPPLPAIAQAA